MNRTVNKLVYIEIRKRLFMIFDRNLPYVVRYEFKLKKPLTKFSHMMILPGPKLGITPIPIFHTHYTDYENHRFPTLISAARFKKQKIKENEQIELEDD